MLPTLSSNDNSTGGLPLPQYARRCIVWGQEGSYDNFCSGRMMLNIEAVIFDWGGVLIEDPAPGLMRYCADALGVSVEQYAAAHQKFQSDFQRGRVAEDVFWTRVCGQLKRPLPDVESLWGDAFRAVYVPRAEMFDLARRVKARGIKTGFLSNTEVPAMQYFHTLGYDMFDQLIFSCAEGTHKPERKIYEIAVERLGTTPSQAVFIDDSPKYIEGAKQAGLSTILFRGIADTKQQLAKLGLEVD